MTATPAAHFKVMQVEDLVQGRSVFDSILSFDVPLGEYFHDPFHCCRVDLSQTMKASMFLSSGPEFPTYCFSLGK